jgi:TPP-dependent pyruvate/acetoin dehydrogenase alpha subunit
LRESLERARDGAGPTLVDAACPTPLTPWPRRAVGPRPVPDEGESGGWSDVDPLERSTRRLVAAAVIDAERENEIRSEVASAVAAAVRAAEMLPLPPADLLFDDVFAKRTRALDDQRSASTSPSNGAGRPRSADTTD